MICVVASVAGIFGAVMGSFAGAQVWRLRARQLVEDKKAGERVDAQELKRLKPLTKKTTRTDRSQCLSCGHALAWYDLLPIISWLQLGGKCRYCRTWIGWSEIILEVAMAAVWSFSVLSWSNWSPVGIVMLLLWLVGTVLLAILFAYDARWFLLPNCITWSFVILGALFAGMQILHAQDVVMALWSLGGAVAILSGVYALLYIVSRGAWIGFGDVKLGLGLALFLGQWHLAFIALFAANFVGTLLVLPGMVTGKLSRHAKVPFGPLLIIGFLISWWFGQALFDLLGLGII